MGRMAIEKERKDNPQKKMEWAKILFPHFQQYGLRNVTMDEVAKVLQKSKATVYKYFKTKDEIVEFVVQYKLGEIAGFVPVLTDESRPFVQRYIKAVEHISTQLLEISNLFLSDLRKFYSEIWDMVNQFRDMAVNQLKDYYESGIKQGIFNNINPKLLALSDQVLFDTLTDPQTLDKYGFTLKSVFEEYFKMRLYGVLKR
ncbi:MAG: hypothetical protein COA57_10415 [Flavobacteriales bacterium]|nr:MAG: hypothetical protein COA57_10415 [Flavobacteriales bacterium]